MRKYGKVIFPVLAAMALLVLGSPKSLRATTSTPATVSPTAKVPEIDPSSGMAAVALLAGTIVIMRGWRNRSV